MYTTTHLEVYADAQGKWRWRAIAGNGEIIAQSEAYASRSSATRGARRAFPDAIMRDVPGSWLR